MDRATLDALIAKTEPVEDLLGSGRITVEGDPMKLGELLSFLDEPDPDFEIVAP
jgi:alkyl sulfatase BDS1-like metallo-beta-lactamase superfamily hydrolase